MRYLFALFAFLAGSRALAFEGVLHMQMTIGELAPIPGDVYLREDGDSRTDTVMPTSNQPMSVLQHHKGDKVVVTTLFHTEKKYVESDAPPPKATGPDPFTGAELRKLADEPIAGQICQHTQIVLATTTIDVWTTDALHIDVDKVRTANQGMAGNMMSALAARGVKGLPLKIRALVQQKTMTVETTSIEPKKLDPTLFVIPKSYAKTTPEQIRTK